MTRFPAKLLLFGEHTVNLGSRALAVPLWRFGGGWLFLPAEKKATWPGRQMQLPQFAQHLFRLRQNGDLPASFGVEDFQADLAAGLIFESDIPTGYGAGSSGALVAAIFARYAGQADLTNFENLSNLRSLFAKMESFFHGTSSGADPLVCYLQQPVLLSKTDVKTVQPPSQQPTAPEVFRDQQLFLLDTGITRQATEFIEYFLEKSRSGAFVKKCEASLLPAVNGGIAGWLAGDGEGLMQAVHQIGEFQLRYLEKMIPPAHRKIWQEGLSGDLFKLKVCGAGGGGFILGVSRSQDLPFQAIFIEP